MPSEHHKAAEAERAHYTGEIINSDSEKIVVVAGPGTGKTFLFRKILEKETEGPTLTLSFINALVDDLSLGLCGLTEVRTLHGFSLSILRSASRSDVRIHPPLPSVIAKDAEILTGSEIDYEVIFQTGGGDEKALEFYKNRKNYYGNYYGFSDIIYALVKYFEEKNDKIPSFERVIVDEFQDFNAIEVRLIELLSQKSPIIISGDDDQSLYMELKNASPEFIRDMYSKENLDYKSYNLPFCSRSTEVIINAANDVTKSAKGVGLLLGRVDKPFQYFTCEEKDKESECHPKIIHCQKFEKAIPAFIQSEVCKLSELEKEKFSVLVIIPPQLKNRLLPYYCKKLKEKGFKNVKGRREFKIENTPTLRGLMLLLDDQHSTLGWRILIESMCKPAVFQELLHRSGDGTPIQEILPKEFKKQTRALVSALRKVTREKPIDEQSLKPLLDAVGCSPLNLASAELRELVQASESHGGPQRREIGEVEITVTTIPSSKGLAADYVFVTHFDETYYAQKGTVTDGNVYGFLVALTRAKKKVYLVSTQENHKPTILDWIERDRIGEIE